MESDAALVGTDGIVVLYAITHIGLHLSLIIHPCDTELIYSVGNAEAFYQIGLFKFRVLVVLLFNGAQHLLYCLMILGLIGETSFEIF